MEITLSTLHKFNNQQIFEKVANHLIKQNKKSSDSVNCRYKLGKLKCAAGCLISKKEYESIEDIEGKTFTRINFINFKNLTEKHINLIRNLQIIHDQTPPENWKKELKNLAKRENLKHDFITE